MKEKQQAKQLSIKSNEFTIYKENIKIKVTTQDLLNIEGRYVPTNNNSTKQELWGIFSNEKLKDYIDTSISDYQKREELINNIVSKTIKNNISGVIIDFSNFNDYKDVIKFVNELMPRLREIGIITGIVINEGMKEEDFLKVVDYIVI